MPKESRKTAARRVGCREEDLENAPEWLLSATSKVLGLTEWFFQRQTYLDMIAKAGFSEIEVVHEISGGLLIPCRAITCRDPACDSVFGGVPENDRAQVSTLAEKITSIKVSATK